MTAPATAGSRLGRGLAMTAVGALLTAIAAYLAAALGQFLLNGGDLVAALLREAPYVLFAGGAVTFALFVLLLLVSNLARPQRSHGASFWINVGLLVVAAVVGSIAGAVVVIASSAAASGLAFFGFFTAALAGLYLFFGGVAGLAITHFALFQSRPVADI